MTFWLTLRVALRALLKNKLRTCLTMLGIIIGVGAVIAMLSIANGARISVEQRVASMGTNFIMIFGGSRPRAGVRAGRNAGIQMKIADWAAVCQLPSVAAACPMVNGGSQLIYGSANWNSQYNGTTPNYLQIRGWPMAQGRMFTEAEVSGGASVAVVGKVVVEKLFGATDPIDKVFRAGNQPLRIIGVLAEKGETGWGGSRDDVFLVPYTTAMRKLKGNTQVNAICASARNSQQVAATEEQIITLLKGRYNCRLEDEDAFYAFNQAEIQKMAEENTQIFTMLLGGIASVSLLVGGIGIMNIMLVSVTERIREIGIRLALGARGVDILQQFLIEAVVLSLLGGAIGVLLGIVIAHVVAYLARWPAAVSPQSIVVAFGFASAIGVFFGFYPAYRASRLDPIEALRTE